MNTSSSTSSEPDAVAADPRLIIRYRAAYLEAKTTITCGHLVELCGWILGALFVAAGVALLTNNTRRDGLIALVAGVIIMVAFRLLGALGCCMGQMLRATLDTAVFSAPFLDEQQKKRVMEI